MELVFFFVIQAIPATKKITRVCTVKLWTLAMGSEKRTAREKKQFIKSKPFGFLSVKLNNYLSKETLF